MATSVTRATRAGNGARWRPAIAGLLITASAGAGAAPPTLFEPERVALSPAELEREHLVQGVSVQLSEAASAMLAGGSRSGTTRARLKILLPGDRVATSLTLRRRAGERATWSIQGPDVGGLLTLDGEYLIGVIQRGGEQYTVRRSDDGMHHLLGHVAYGEDGEEADEPIGLDDYMDYTDAMQ